MRRTPDLAAVEAVELRIAQSRQNTLKSLRRVPVAFRATLARPSVSAALVGAAGLAGFWMGRLPKSAPPLQEASGTKIASFAFIVRAFIVRYGMDHLPFVLTQVWAARQRRAT